MKLGCELCELVDVGLARWVLVRPIALVKLPGAMRDPCAQRPV